MTVYDWQVMDITEDERRVRQAHMGLCYAVDCLKYQQTALPKEPSARRALSLSSWIYAVIRDRAPSGLRGLEVVTNRLRAATACVASIFATATTASISLPSNRESELAGVLFTADKLFPETDPAIACATWMVAKLLTPSKQGDRPTALQKGEAKGGTYHRRVTDPVTGAHRYFYC